MPQIITRSGPPAPAPTSLRPPAAVLQTRCEDVCAGARCPGQFRNVGGGIKHTNLFMFFCCILSH